MHLHLRRALVLLPLLATPLSAAPPAAPAPAPAEYTQKEFYRDNLAFQLADLVDTYKTAGKHNPKWDASATAALETYAHYLAQVNTEDIAYPALYTDTKISLEQLGAAAQKAIDDGAIDPMIYYARGISLMYTAQIPDMHKWFDKAAAAMPGSPYSAYRQFNVRDRLRLFLDTPAALADAWPALESLGFIMAKGPFLNAAAHRQIASILLQDYAARPTESYEADLARLAAAPGVDPWIVHYLTLELQTTLAWQARGDGFADTVTPEGYRGFQAHLAKAAAAGNSAFKIHPELAGPAITMMRVASGATGRQDVQQWFDRALAAQLDDSRAYAQRYATLVPRWGGSNAEILALGKKAAESARFDTAVPFQFIAAASAIASDFQGDPKIFLDPDVKKISADVITKYRAQFKDDPRLSELFKTHWAAARAAATNWPVVRSTLEELTGPPDRAAFGYYHLDFCRVENSIYLKTASNQNDVNRYEDALDAKNFRNAQAAIDAIIAKDHPIGRAAEFFNDLKSACQLMQTYRANRPLQLTDPATAPLWLTNRLPLYDANSLINPYRNDWLSVTTRFYLPDRHYHIHLEFKYLKAFGDIFAATNLSFGAGPTGGHWSVHLFTNPPHATLTTPGSIDPVEFKFTPQDNNTLDVIYFDGIPKVTLNSTPVDFSQADPKKVQALPKENAFGFGTNVPLQITDFTFQHLATQP